MSLLENLSVFFNYSFIFHHFSLNGFYYKDKHIYFIKLLYAYSYSRKRLQFYEFLLQDCRKDLIVNLP